MQTLSSPLGLRELLNGYRCVSRCVAGENMWQECTTFHGSFSRRAQQKVEINKAEASKAEENSGEEGDGEGGGDRADAETPLDLERFTHVWR